MKILVINCGSSSLKYQLIDMSNENVLAKGLCDRIGLSQSFLKHSRTGHDAVVIEKDIHNHKKAIKEVLDVLTDATLGVISSMDEILAIGHRVVHGGEKFTNSVIINNEVLTTIEECCELAPLHNPPNIVGIQACQQLMPNTPEVAVFDTSFHQTMPPYAYLYPVPYDLYTKHKLRKYGFHGTSHKYVAERTSSVLQKPISELKIVTCHLGNGSSICAIKNGKSIDTSMGFTPLEGLPMGTRSGSIDPAAIQFIMEKENMTIKEVTDMLNKKSGVLGLSHLSSDFRDLEEAAETGNDQAELALDVFNYRVKKLIGEYAAAMGGIDAVVFTGGIGENNWILRNVVAEGLAFLGIEIDAEKNKIRGKEIDISTENAKVRMLVIPTNEELAIAREAKKLVF
jgi:acetate kinase